MRKFKHRTLGFIAKEGHRLSYYKDDDGIEATTFSIQSKLLENSQDREEVIEKDWIEDAFKCYCNQYENNVTSEIDNINFRSACEKYAPKVRNFTRDEVCKWSNKAYFDGAEERYLIDFLEEHNLLSSDE